MNTKVGRLPGEREVSLQSEKIAHSQTVGELMKLLGLDFDEREVEKFVTENMDLLLTAFEDNLVSQRILNTKKFLIIDSKAFPDKISDEFLLVAMMRALEKQIQQTPNQILNMKPNEQVLKLTTKDGNTYYQVSFEDTGETYWMTQEYFGNFVQQRQMEITYEAQDLIDKIQNYLGEITKFDQFKSVIEQLNKQYKEMYGHSMFAFDIRAIAPEVIPLVFQMFGLSTDVINSIDGNEDYFLEFDDIVDINMDMELFIEFLTTVYGQSELGYDKPAGLGQDNMPVELELKTFKNNFFGKQMLESILYLINSERIKQYKK